MANKKALHDLQMRLVERIAAARALPRLQSWLAVECRGHGLLLPLEQAGEIFPLVALQAVPHAQAWFAGVANLRGSLHGVVDLARFLALPPAPPHGDDGTERARLIALGAALGLNCALRVDALAGLRGADQLREEIDHDTNASDARPAFAPRRWRDTDGRVWQGIDLALLVQEPRFLSIGA